MEDLTPKTSQNKAMERVEPAVTDLLHEFGDEWQENLSMGPLTRRALKRRYARDIFNIVFDFIVERHALDGDGLKGAYENTSL